MSAAVRRLPIHSSDDIPGAEPWWYLGQLSESLLALVLQSSDRAAIEGCLAGLCSSLREPVAIGGAQFHLTPYAGVAVLGQDASSPKLLLDHARAAASEARCSGASEVRFFTDTLRLKSLARLDIARELREAIANRDIRLRYVGRHELASKRRVTWVGYLRWLHPLRGEIRPAEFLKVAEATGLATDLSRAVLAGLNEDFAGLAAAADGDTTCCTRILQTTSGIFSPTAACLQSASSCASPSAHSSRATLLIFAVSHTSAFAWLSTKSRAVWALWTCWRVHRSGACSSIGPGSRHCAAMRWRTRCVERELAWPQRSVLLRLRPAWTTNDSTMHC
jgi:hypothetical protein